MAEIDKALPNVKQTINVPNPEDVEIAQQEKLVEQQEAGQPVEQIENEDGSIDINFDPKVGSPGEDEAWGGVMGIHKGLFGKYGKRMLDTPLSESAFIGAAIGAATCGMRPVAELMFIDFLGVCFDQIFKIG